jgi:dipeptidyl aminopeptidase/acylaminoacyl peptidase
MRLLSEGYGPDKLNDFWRMVGRLRSVEAALARVYGLSMEEFNRLYLRELRARYWPTYNDLEQLEDIARPLTGLDRDMATFHGRPALNPDGDLLVCFTDRDGLIDLYLLSALDGREIRRLGRSMRASRFESFHSFRSGLDWSPDGREIVLVAKSDNREKLHTIDVATGEITRSLDLALDVAANPSWSPDGGLIAVVGTWRGRTDLYLVEIEPGALQRFDLDRPVQRNGDVRMVRLTDDTGDEGAPRWSPDGTALAFSFNPLAELEYTFEVLPDGRRRLIDAVAAADTSRAAPPPAVDLLDLAAGARHRLYEPDDRRRDPIWIDERTLAIVDGHDGIDNLALADLDPTRSRVVADRRLTNVLGGIQHLTYSQRSDRLALSAFNNAGYDLYAADDFVADWSTRRPVGERPHPVVTEPPLLVTRDGPADTVRIDPERIGLIEDYDPSFRIDASRAGAGGAVYWTQAGGLGFANLLTLTDDLGDRRIDLLLNFYGAIDNSDLAITYTYLKRRIDLSAGAFLYNNFYNSVITSVGELLTDDTLFREKNYGFFTRASYPLSTFERFDLDLQLFNSDRTEYEFDEAGFLRPVAKRRNQLIQPTLGFVHDNALFGLHGPLTGSRWSVSVARGLPLSESSLDRWNAVGDLRKYWLMGRRSSLALHLTYAHSGGDDPRAFVIGGPWTLRGYRYYDFQTVDRLAGTRMLLGQLEYRLPFVDYLIFGWPGRWGLGGIGGAVFLDTGAAWFGDSIQLPRDLRSDFGLGLRANVFGLPLKFDWAWRTDFQRVQGSMFHFSIGPNF